MKFFKAICNIIRYPRNLYSLIRASIVYYLGKREAMDKFRKTGRRYYCIYDPNSKKLVSITYKRYKDSNDSYQYLRFRGRIAPISLDKFIEGALYYTPSKNGAQEMSKERQQQCLDIMRRNYFCKSSTAEPSSSSRTNRSQPSTAGSPHKPIKS